MSAKPNYFLLGIFILVAICILVSGLLIFGSGRMFRPRIMLETYVEDSVQGVEVGTPVKFRGVKIGQVEAINFTFNVYGTQGDDPLYNYIVLYMEIEKEIFPGMFTTDDLVSILEKNIAKGLRVRIEPQGITGMNYLNMDYVDAANSQKFPPLKIKWKPQSYYIPSAPGRITSFLDSINHIMADLEKMNVEQISKDFRALLDQMNEAVESAKLGELSGNARELMTGLQASNKDLQAILKNLEPSTRLNSEQVHAIIHDLARASANMAEFSNEIKKKPSLLLWGAPKSSPTPKRE